VLARDELRAFLARMLGWRNDVAVELELRSVELAVAGDTALVLLGPGDVVPIARSLHWRVRERLQPFIVADPRRGKMPPHGAFAVEQRDGRRSIRARAPRHTLLATGALAEGLRAGICATPGRT
jgi:hypothetical protein